MSQAAGSKGYLGSFVSDPVCSKMKQTSNISKKLLFTLLFASLMLEVSIAGQKYWTGGEHAPRPADLREWGIFVRGNWANGVFHPTLKKAAIRECREHANNRSDNVRIAWVKPVEPGGRLEAHVDCDQPSGTYVHSHAHWYSEPCSAELYVGELYFPDGSLFCIEGGQPEPGPNFGSAQCGFEGSSPVGKGTNPINIATGNKYEAVRVVSPPPASKLQFSFFYNSLQISYDPREIELSGDSIYRRWRHSYSQFLHSPDFPVMLAEGDPESLALYDGKAVNVIVHLDDGKQVVFGNYFDASTKSTQNEEWHTNNTELGLSLITRLDQSGNFHGFLLTHRDGRKEMYDADGRLATINYGGNDNLTLAYDAISNKLVSVTDHMSRSLDFSYDENGRIRRVTDSQGAVYILELDANFNLRKIVYPDLTPEDLSDNPFKMFHYDYVLDTGGSTPRGFAGHLTSVSDENGNTSSMWWYDGQGRAISSAHAEGTGKYGVTYNADGTTTVTDPLSHLRTYRFTTGHGVMKVTDAAGGACTQCGSGDAQAYAYDGNGLLSRKTDHNGNVTTYDRDAVGREIGRTQAFGTLVANIVTTTWDSTLGKPLTLEKSGRTTTYSYDAHGRLLSTRIRTTR